MRSCLVDLLKQIWKEGTIPTEWRMSIVVPLYKRGDKEKTENYRGISLLCSAYKVYAEILRNRLGEAIELRGMLLKATLVSERVGRRWTTSSF